MEDQTLWPEGSMPTADEEHNPFLESLDPEFRNHEALKGIRDVDGLARRHLEAVAQYEEARAGYTFAESPEAIAVPTAEGLDVHPELMAAFQKAAFDAGLSQEQVNGLADFWNGFISGQVSDAREAAIRADRALKEEWSGDYDRNIKLATMTARRFGGAELADFLQEIGGLAQHPTMAAAFFRVHQAAAEDTFVAGGPAGAGHSGIQRTESGLPLLKFGAMAHPTSYED